MLKALVPVDSAGNSLGAIRHVVKLVQGREPLEIHLLNVQTTLPCFITQFVSREVLYSTVSVTTKPRRRSRRRGRFRNDIPG